MEKVDGRVEKGREEWMEDREGGGNNGGLDGGQDRM